MMEVSALDDFHRLCSEVLRFKDLNIWVLLGDEMQVCIDDHRLPIPEPYDESRFVSQVSNWDMYIRRCMEFKSRSGHFV